MFNFLDKNNLNIYFLTFKSKELENEYRQLAIKKSLPLLRLAIMVGVLVFSITYFKVLNHSSNILNNQSWLLIVSNFIVPFLGVVFFIYSFFITRAWFLKLYLPAISLFYIIGAIAVIYDVANDNSFILFLYVRILFFTLIPFFTLWVLMVSNLIIFIALFLIPFLFFGLEFEPAIKQTMQLLPMMVISAIAFYAKQYAERINFINLKTIIKQKETVEKSNAHLLNKSILAVILKKSTDTNLDLHQFLQDSLNILLELPWLKIQSKGSVFLTNTDGNLEMVAHKDLGELVQKCALLKPGDCLCGKALLKKELLFSNCVTADHTIVPKDMTPHGHYNIPIKINDKVLGVLNIYVEHGHQSNKDEKDFFLMVCDTLASVIHRHQLEQSKKIIYKKVSDSINYSKRIQNSMLPTKEAYKTYFNDVTLTYLPKETVSGDFYCVKEKDDLIYIAVGDSTGHGVPGAMVATLGIQMLHHIIETENDTSVVNILTQLNQSINLVLNNNNDFGSDGMDLALICVDKINQIIKYTGAKGIIYHYANNELNKLPTDRFSIGQKYINQKVVFTEKTLKYNENDMLFLLSDGIIDQISSTNKKRIGSKKIKQFFEKIAPLTENQRDKEINDFINKHNSLQQTDDIILLTLKL